MVLVLKFKNMVYILFRKRLGNDLMVESKKVRVHPENCVGCLTCQLACSFTYTDRFNPLEARIIVEWSPEGSKIVFTDECTDCGICAEYCFYGALEKIEEGD